jgi:hypothetical protein
MQVDIGSHRLDLGHKNRSEDFTLSIDQREEELKKYLDILAKRPEVPNRYQSVQSFIQELEGIQAGKPGEAEWVMWRECKKCEEDLAVEFKGLRIQLQFNLS